MSNDNMIKAYNVKTKEKNVPVQDAVVSRTAKGGYIAKGHDGRNQDGKRECQWNGCDGDIRCQFKNAGQVKPFSHQVINVFPKKLHHQHEECDEKGRDEWTDECF